MFVSSRLSKYTMFVEITRGWRGEDFEKKKKEIDRENRVSIRARCSEFL